jgi:serine/threonine-protein kinase HipA
MSKCPITYEIISEGIYSKSGLDQLSPKLNNLSMLPYTKEDFGREYVSRAGKLSIQGVQPKLSVRLNIPHERFELVNKNGKYILKPPNDNYPELPQNEDLTMKMAALCSIETSWHGLLWAKNNQLCYIVKRFDRVGHKAKLPLEDFAQLSQKKRITKYSSSMENVVSIIDRYATFPILEKIKLFRIVVFNFLTGNEDMHLKNFSLLTRKNKIELSPAYDLSNTTIAIQNPIEEIALPIAGKKSNLRRKHFIEYLGEDIMKIPVLKINEILSEIESSISKWENLISISFLSDDMKEKYLELLQKRIRVIYE